MVHKRNLQNESELLEADAAVFAANPNEYVVLFRDFQKQLQAGTIEIQGWNTQLKSIVDQATNMLTLSQLGGNPPAEHSQYIKTARGGIRDLLTKMEACDAFLKKRKAESAAASPIGTTLKVAAHFGLGFHRIDEFVTHSSCLTLFHWKPIHAI